VQAFGRSYYGRKKKGGGSYTHPNVPTQKNERYYTHKMVAKKCILDGFKGASIGQPIDVSNSTYDCTVKFSTTIQLPPQKIKLSTAQPPFGITFKIIDGAIVIDEIDSTAANGKNRITALNDTVVVTGDIVLGLVSGAKDTLFWDATEKTVDNLMTKMDALQKAKKAINLYVRSKIPIHNQVKGNKVLSTARGAYSKFANPLVGSLDEAALDKAVATEAGFHRRHDQGTKKKWTHVRIDKVDALIPKLKKVLERDVKTSMKTDRPVFPTEANRVDTGIQREASLVTALCSRLHEKATQNQ
jgi:hypothetical protein